MRAIVVGLGQGLSDFNSLYQSGMQAGGDQFTSAWNDIQTQLSSEGAGTDAINDAKASFADSYNQFSQSVAGSAASDIGSAIDGAKQYVLAGKTIAGAISNVQNLVRDIQDGAPPIATANAFIGTLVGIAVAAGAVSAGVGAAIVTAVALVAEVLSNFFNLGSSPGYNICGSTYSNQPNWVVGCVAAYGNVINTSNDSDWRRFPNPTNGADAVWFCAGSGQAGSSNPGMEGCGSYFNWPSNNSVNWAPAGFPDVYRAIDRAFPMYHHLECEHIQAQAITSVQIPQGAQQVSEQVGPLQITVTPETQAFANFQKSFFTAWQANQEYILNGLKPQPDWQVLLHAARIWNAAHEKGNGYSLQAQGGSSSAYIPAWPAMVAPLGSSMAQYNDPAGNCSGGTPGGFGGTQSGPPFYPYEALLINDVISNYGSNDPAGTQNPLMVNNALQINTGPLKSTSGFHFQPSHIINGLTGITIAHIGAAAGAKAAAAAPTTTGMSTGTKWAIGLGIVATAGLAGLYWYSRAHHMTLKQGTQHLWADVKSKFHRTPRMRRATSRRALPRHG